MAKKAGMAELVLYYDDLKEVHLPQLCMRCGEPSCTVVQYCFQWAPPALGLFGGLFALAFLQRRITVPIPLCRRHRYMWLKRRLWIGLGLFGPVMCVLAIFLVAYFSGQQRGQP